MPVWQRIRLETKMSKKRAAVKLLQGYLWHPKTEKIALDDYLPETFEGEIYILWDDMASPPFSFFDDGSLASEQQFYQLTVIELFDKGQEKGRDVRAIAEQLQEFLEKTPGSVGWQIFEDLRAL